MGVPLAPHRDPHRATGRGDYGDADLRAWIERHQPDAVLAGHVHEAPFRADGSWADRIGPTWVFNPGHTTGPVPAHVVLDLAARRARWSSYAGDEELSLDDEGPPARSLG